jgi:hypothetical protein
MQAAIRGTIESSSVELCFDGQKIGASGYL